MENDEDRDQLKKKFEHQFESLSVETDDFKIGEIFDFFYSEIEKRDKEIIEWKTVVKVNNEKSQQELASLRKAMEEKEKYISSLHKSISKI